MKREAEGPVDSAERAKKASMGSNEPKRSVRLSAVPLAAIWCWNCCRTREARVRPAMARRVPVESGVLNPHCWADARLKSVSRSSVVKDESW